MDFFFLKAIQLTRYEQAIIAAGFFYAQEESAERVNRDATLNEQVRLEA